MSIFPYCFPSEFMEQRRNAVFKEGKKEANTLSSIDSSPANTIEHQFYRHFVVFEPISVLETLQEEVLYLNTLCARPLDLNSYQ